MRIKTLLFIVFFLLSTLDALAQPTIGGGNRIFSLGQLSGALCQDGEGLVNDSGTSWVCGSVGAGASSIIIDLADDDSNESSALAEIATTGDSNSIFSEPSANKFLIDLGNAWPAADALSANGSNCSAGQAAGGVDASGNAESCIAPLTINAVSTEENLETTAGGIDLIVATEIDSLTELQLLIGGVEIITDTKIATMAQLEALLSGVNVIQATEIDTIAELEAIVGENLIIDGELTNVNAATATALAANGTNCTGVQVAQGIDASGNAEGCFTPAGSGDLSAVDIDTEAELEAIVGVDFAKTTGDNVASATALAANGSNCSPGNFPLGVDANGAAESCTDVVLSSEIDTEAELESVMGGIDLLVSTELDNMTELQQQVGSVNIITSTEIDSESEFEAIVGEDFVKAADNIATATALAANGTNCSSGQAAGGVDASGNAEACFTPAGGGGATGTLDQSYDLGAEIDGANSLANAVVIGNGTDTVSIYGTGGEGRIEGPNSGDITLSPANDLILEDGSSEVLRWVGGVATFASGLDIGWRRIFLPADMWIGSGTCDADPSSLGVSGTFRRFLTCDQTSGGFINTLYPLPMPVNWDGTTALRVRLMWDSPSGGSLTMVWRSVSRCRGNNIVDADSWGSATSDMISTFVNSNAIVLSNESNAMTPDGTCTTDPMTLQIELRQISSSTATTARFLGAELFYQVLTEEAR